MSAHLIHSDPGAERPEVSWAEHERVGTLVLNRPERHNAIDLAFARGLLTASRRARQAADEGRINIVVIRASGPSFCVGGDLRAIADSPDPVAHLAELVDISHAAIRELLAVPVVVFAAVHGSIAGAGLALVLAADVVQADDTASFRFGYVAVGLSPDCGGSMLSERIGAARAIEFALTNRAMAAEEAARLGIVTDVVPPGDLGRVVSEQVACIRDAPRDAAISALAMLRTDRDAVEGRLARERDAIVLLMATASTQRLVRRFATRAAEPVRPSAPGRGSP